MYAGLRYNIGIISDLDVVRQLIYSLYAHILRKVNILCICRTRKRVEVNGFLIFEEGTYSFSLMHTLQNCQRYF